MAAPQNCPRCGAALTPAAVTCAKCGAPVSALQEAPTSTARGSDDVTQLAYMPPELLDSDRTVPLSPVHRFDLTVPVNPVFLPASLGPIPELKSTEAKTQPFNALLIEALALKPSAETVPLGKVAMPGVPAVLVKVPTLDRTPMVPSKVLMVTPPMGEPMSEPLANMETSLIPGRLNTRGELVARSSPLQDSSDSPTNRALQELQGGRGLEDEQPPWLNPWVLAVGAMLLLALGLLIGLLVL